MVLLRDDRCEVVATTTTTIYGHEARLDRMVLVDLNGASRESDKAHAESQSITYLNPGLHHQTGTPRRLVIGYM